MFEVHALYFDCAAAASELFSLQTGQDLRLRWVLLETVGVVAVNGKLSSLFISKNMKYKFSHSAPSTASPCPRAVEPGIVIVFL